MQVGCLIQIGARPLPRAAFPLRDFGETAGASGRFRLLAARMSASSMMLMSSLG